MTLRRRCVLLAALALGACTQPPTAEIAAAEQQVERARAGGADQYAPDRFRQAEAALVLARQKVQEHDYRSALSAANDAAESARNAIESSGTARAQARKAAEGALSTMRGTLDRAAAERTQAARAGVSRAELAPLDAVRDRAEATLKTATAQLEKGDILAAAATVDAITAEVTTLPERYREARTRHAKRPVRRRR